MCENEADRVSMNMQELTKSVHLSIIKAEQEGNQEVLKQPQLQENLLQVTVRDRTIVLDLAKKIP